MAYTLVLTSLPEVETPPEVSVIEEACETAKRRCMPAYVFSIEGQVGFRKALRHLSECRRRPCMELKRVVTAGMKEKLTWLFQEEVLLGCVQVQPYLYGANHIIFNKQQFGPAAWHLAKCPHDSCAQLRRSVLLRIRDSLRPA